MSCSLSKNISEKELTGTYQWSGIYGVGATIELKKDGVFEYNWVAGLTSGTTKGKWTCEARTIKLNSDLQPGINSTPDFEIIKTEKGNTGTLTLKVLNTDNNPLLLALCYLQRNDSITASANTGTDGMAQLPKADSDSLIIKFVGYKTAYLKYDPAVSYYEIKMIEMPSHYVYFTNKELIFKNNRMYDTSIKKDKYVRKNYYERMHNEN